MWIHVTDLLKRLRPYRPSLFLLCFLCTVKKTTFALICSCMFRGEPMHLEYGFEKFGAAVHELAASSKTIKERLRDATYHLGVLREHHVPEEMSDEFNRLYEL